MGHPLSVRGEGTEFTYARRHSAFGALLQLDSHFAPRSGKIIDLENIRYELRPPIAVVTLDRPKVLNALNHRSMTELEQVFLDIRQNPEVRAVLLTGAGEKAFVAGADIRELAPLTPLEGSSPPPAGKHLPP